MIDYAYPCMMAENALKKAHNSMLEQDFDTAIEQAYVVFAETKLMVNAIKEMKERRNGLRQQTQTV